jgi:hypothetical protein
MALPTPRNGQNAQAQLHLLPEECICAIILHLHLKTVGHACVAHRAFVSACKLQTTWKEIWGEIGPPPPLISQCCC